MNCNGTRLIAKGKGYSAHKVNDGGAVITLTLIQKWLMDEHNIFIAIAPFPLATGFRYFVIKPDMGFGQPHSYGGYDTYLLALHAAINEALKLIPDKHEQQHPNA